MIGFLSNWIEQITISVIIVSIFELILPNGNIKKYIKVVLGIYIIFCIIIPFVDSSALYDIQNMNLSSLTNNVDIQSNTQNVNQESMNLRIQDLYIEEIKKDLEITLNEKGYKVVKCDIEAELDANGKNPGIHNINLTLSKNQIANIEKVEIGKKEENNIESAEIENIKTEISSKYDINKNIVRIKIN